MDIVTQPKQNDISVENNGIKIYIEKDVEPFIKDAIIDFDNNRGFSIAGLKQSGCC